MRLHLTLALITLLLLVITLRSSQRHRFTFEQAQAFAEAAAKTKYVPPPGVLPPQLKNLTPQQEQGIFWKDEYRLWRTKGLPFQVDFYHLDKDFPGGPKINTVDRKGPHDFAYSPRFFNFSNLTFDPPLPTNLPYAGFYVRYPLPTATQGKPDSLNGFFSVESIGSPAGGNYFRVLARDQVYGLSSRGIALNTAVEGRHEEFPDFKEWWLQEPASNATELVLDALLDGPSVTGAYEFKLHPGAVTSVDVRATLFFRQPVERLGLAPFSSMYLFGENAKDHLGDNVHPEIHDSDGLLINKNNGEWVWRPLQQTSFLQNYTFPDENPRGFGLLQRDRDFKNYQDLDRKYNVRPSAWITPHGNWGKGEIMLIQPNSRDVNTDNVTLFWHPGTPSKAGDRLDISYTIDFYMNDAARPPLAYCRETLINNPAPPPPPPVAAATSAPTASKPAPAPSPIPSTPLPVAAPVPPKNTVPVQFVVDFAGNGIENIPANQPPDLTLTCSPPETFIRESSVQKNGYDNSWRVTFTIFPAKPHLSTELLCSLKRHGNTLTETWSYTWHQ